MRARPVDPIDAHRSALYARHAATQRAWAARGGGGPRGLLARILRKAARHAR